MQYDKKYTYAIRVLLMMACTDVANTIRAQAFMHSVVVTFALIHVYQGIITQLAGDTGLW